MILAVDAGNTRVKWALHDGRTFTSEGWATHADLDALDTQWACLQAPSAVVIANVAGDEIGQKLRAFSGRWQAAPRWAHSVRSQAGVINHYDDPSQLGVDRWAALIGARGFSSGPCIVINAGTATTIDAMAAQGRFIGGIIVPGFDLMHKALAANTAQLSAEHGIFTAFPRATRDAITSGTIQALCGAVERMHEAMLLDGHDDPELIFSGGTGELVARHMGRPVRIVDNLVLEGLVRIAREPQ